VLDVSRIARGLVELRLAQVELGRVVGAAMEMSSPLLESKNQRVELDVPAEGLPLNADEGRLAQVVCNLLTNAAKYTPAGGRISLRASRSLAHVELVVADEGEGIAPELLPRVFEPFVQGEPSLPRRQGGLGLGLTLVRNLVERHGGAVRAESEGLGRGARFTVSLPAANASD
jgi:signal transduction histidine kinase